MHYWHCRKNGQVREYYHLPKKSANFGWNVMERLIWSSADGKFPEFLEKYRKNPIKPPKGLI